MSSSTIDQAAALSEAERSDRGPSFKLLHEIPGFNQVLLSAGGQLVEPRKKQDKKVDPAHWRRYFEDWEPDEE
jgi:hypothetical protein